MSKIQKLPENVLDAVTPYLVTGEIIEKALLQDNKKPREIWLIKTNQAIILHGQQPDRPQPAIMVLPLDEIPEIDYLQKIDDIQLIIYSKKNNGKAVFHFETSASKEVEKFLEDLGDLITFRYQTNKGKITVVQKALPIGDKERKVFGRGKPQDVPFISKNKNVTQNDAKNNTVQKTVEKTPVKPIEKPAVKEPVKAEQPKINKPATDNKEKLVLKTNESKVPTETKTVKPAISESPSSKSSLPEKSVEKTAEKAVLPKATESTKKESKPEIKSVSSSSSIISHLQENPVPKTEPAKEDKPKKEIDYGSPLYFITVTIISTIVGFFCLSFFKTISKVVKYFKRG